MRIDELDTPVATVDLVAVRRNIARVQAYCDIYGLAFRPHVKTHKIPAIAHLQLGAGAVGVTCQKIGEAEVMVAAGIRDIMLAFPIVTRRKLERLRALARIADLTAVADSRAGLDALSAAFADAERPLRVLVECDTGLGRAGVQTPRDAAKLMELAVRLPGLEPHGFMTYPTAPGTAAFFAETIALIESQGLRADVVSGGGTFGYDTSHLVSTLTEVRCGTYVYGDAACVANGSVDLDDVALRIRATVVSRPTRERAILDAGSKTLTMDPNEAGGRGHGIVLEHRNAVLYALHEEHGFLDVSRCATPPAIGDVVTIVPNHACGCTNLHDSVVVHERHEVVAVWAVAARGAIR